MFQIQEKLAAAGTASGPAVMVYSWLETATDVLQIILLVVSIFATAASGIYYIRENRKKNK